MHTVDDAEDDLVADDRQRGDGRNALVHMIDGPAIRIHVIVEPVPVVDAAGRYVLEVQGDAGGLVVFEYGQADYLPDLLSRELGGIRAGIQRVRRALPRLEILRQVYIVVGVVSGQRCLIVDVIPGGRKRSPDPRGQPAFDEAEKVFVAFVDHDVFGRYASQQKAVYDFHQAPLGRSHGRHRIGAYLDPYHVAGLKQLAPGR